MNKDTLLMGSLDTLLVKIKPFLGPFISDKTPVAVTQVNRPNLAVLAQSQSISAWLVGEHYMNFVKLKVPCPKGIVAPYATYIDDLEATWTAVRKLREGLLEPLATALAKVANKPAMLQIPGQFQQSVYKAQLLDVNPEDYQNKLGAHFLASNPDQQAFGKLFRSGTEFDALAVRIVGLNEQIDDVSRKSVQRQIDSIAASIDVISQTEDISDKARSDIQSALFTAGKWVELYGSFMLQVQMLNEAFVLTANKLLEIKK